MLASLIITALSLAVGSSLMYQHKSATMTMPANAPDAYMEEVLATIMDKTGVPSLKIKSPRMTHYAKNDTTEISFPELALYRNSPEPWNIRANHATAHDGINQIIFKHNVIITHAGDSNNPPTVIKTSVLTAYPHKQLAETDQIITLKQPNVLVKGKGMQANMTTGKINLLSQSRVTYVPNS